MLEAATKTAYLIPAGQVVGAMRTFDACFLLGMALAAVFISAAKWWCGR